MSNYCRICDGYSAEVGKPNDEGLCPYCATSERPREVITLTPQEARIIADAYLTGNVDDLDAAAPIISRIADEADAAVATFADVRQSMGLPPLEPGNTGERS